MIYHQLFILFNFFKNVFVYYFCPFFNKFIFALRAYDSWKGRETCCSLQVYFKVEPSDGQLVEMCIELVGQHA